MPRDSLVLGVDCSTHGAKAVAWTFDGTPVAEGRAEFELLRPRSGWYEQHADDWRRATVDAIGQVARTHGRDICAIGITHQRETFVGVDRDGHAVRNAIVWMDERAVSQVGELRAAVSDDAFHRITGKPLSVTPSVSKILWIRQHEPAAFRKAERWLDVLAFLVRALTGVDATSAASAESMGLVDLARGAWSQVLLQAVGLSPDNVPRLVPAGTVVGTLLEDIASDLGLPAGLPVVATAGDGQAAAVAAGVFDLDLAYLNLGTAIVSGTVGPAFLTSRAFRTMGGAVPGTFLFESDLKGGTFTIDWLIERLLGQSLSLAELETRAAAVPPGAEGLVLVPYLAGVMNPYWDDDASGILIGLRGNHGPAHVFRAILEGIAFEQRLHLREIERATGVPIREVRVLGGGAASSLWCGILADVLRRPVVRTRSREATSLGAAMMAAAAIGLFPSARQAADAMGATAESFVPGPASAHYSDIFDQVYEVIYPALRDALGGLAVLSR